MVHQSAFRMLSAREVRGWRSWASSFCRSSGASPRRLITAELATAFPEDSGYVAWVTAAFGPYWGFQEGFWSWYDAMQGLDTGSSVQYLHA